MLEVGNYLLLMFIYSLLFSVFSTLMIFYFLMTNLTIPANYLNNLNSRRYSISILTLIHELLPLCS